MQSFTTRDRINVLNGEIEFFKTQIREHDTGHFYTAISVIEHRIQQLEQQFIQEQQQRNR